MTRNLAWARAYLEQAKADLDAARRLSGPPAGSVSILAVALQMSLEKTMKAATLWSDKSTAPEFLSTSHHAFGRVKAVSLRNPKQPISRIVIGPDWKNRAAREALFHFLEELERLSPSVAARNAQHLGLNRLCNPSLEYPWENLQRRKCYWPERDLDLIRQLSSPGSGRLKAQSFAYLERVIHDLDRKIPAVAEWV